MLLAGVVRWTHRKLLRKASSLGAELCKTEQNLESSRNKIGAWLRPHSKPKSPDHWTFAIMPTNNFLLVEMFKKPKSSLVICLDDTWIWNQFFLAFESDNIFSAHFPHRLNFYRSKHTWFFFKRDFSLFTLLCEFQGGGHICAGILLGPLPHFGQVLPPQSLCFSICKGRRSDGMCPFWFWYSVSICMCNENQSLSWYSLFDQRLMEICAN